MDFISANVVVDLVFTETKLGTEGGLEFVQMLRRDPSLKIMPVLIYAAASNRELVQRGMALQVQNFLIKPYQETAITTELRNAMANPWRPRHFEEEKSFCQMMGITPAELRRQLSALHLELATMKADFANWAQALAAPRILERLEEVNTIAETTGAWGIVECLSALRTALEEDSWPAFSTALEQLEFGRSLIYHHLNPGNIPDGFLTDDQVKRRTEEQQLAQWEAAPAKKQCPMVTWVQVQQQLEHLSGAPVMETAAAAFQMSVAGNPSSLSPLMELVDRDPGLAAELLFAANAVHTHDSDDARIENPQLAVSLIGDQALVSLARKLETVEERWMNRSPLSWAQYWTFQRGMAHTARYVCRFLEFNSLETRACTAALIHDLGKLLLVRLYPHGFQVIRDYSLREKISQREAERLFLNCTTPEMAAHFGEKRGLPKAYCNAMRWFDSPDEATEDRDLVGIVALSRELCMRNHLGSHGEYVPAVLPPLEDTAAWKVMKEKVFFGFNLKKFEIEVQAASAVFKADMQGNLQVAQV